MVYPANNYQLGGLIAGARRGREYQGEIRELRKKAEAAARRKKKSGFLGSIGSIVGGTIGFAVAGPAGAAIGAGLGKGAGESSYARESYKGGKYAQETRGDLRNLENDYRKGIGERALVAGLQAAVMPGVYDKLGKVAGQGAGWLKGLGSGSGTVDAMGLESGLGIAGTAVPPMATKSITAVPPMATKSITQGLGYGSDAPLPKPMTPSLPFGELSPEMLGDIPFEMPAQQSYTPWDPLAAYKSPEPADFGYLSGMKSPQFYGGTSAPKYAGGGLINYMMPRRMQTGGYATATSPLQALEQMGFEGVADDERLQDYLEDLPDWQQGYAQQVGDITTAGQQQMGQIGAQMRTLQDSSGFGASGIGAGAAQQARTGVEQEFQRGRRGIVEGFQGDLLTAVRDIESKGEFEFGAEEQEQTTPTYVDPAAVAATYYQHPEPAGGCPAGSTWNGSQGKCQSDDPFSNDPVMTCTERGMPPPAGGCTSGYYWDSNTCACEWAP
jgi:hypothetical protein